VPHGKLAPNHLKAAIPVRYLRQAPTAPPLATRRRCFIIAL
jgi:hypothetical protein